MLSRVVSAKRTDGSEPLPSNQSITHFDHELGAIQNLIVVARFIMSSIKYVQKADEELCKEVDFALFSRLTCAKRAHSVLYFFNPPFPFFPFGPLFFPLVFAFPSEPLVTLDQLTHSVKNVV
jgi:hypothetical protein